MRSAWAAAPARGGSSTTASNWSSSRTDSGSRKRSRTRASMGFNPCARFAAAVSAAIARLSPSKAATAALPRERKRERSDARKKIRNPLRLARQRGEQQLDQHGLGFGHRLQKCPGRGLDRDTADRHRRRAAERRSSSPATMSRTRPASCASAARSRTRSGAEVLQLRCRMKRRGRDRGASR